MKYKVGEIYMLKSLFSSHHKKWIAMSQLMRLTGIDTGEGKISMQLFSLTAGTIETTWKESDVGMIPCTIIEELNEL